MQDETQQETAHILRRGPGPLVATAIHDGAAVREELQRYMVLDPLSRRREEDPFTEQWTRIAPTGVVGLRSRFEFDLNRPREQAVYLTPEDCWGLHVWNAPLPPEVVERSLAYYDQFYRMLHDVYTEMESQYGKFVVYDLHTYNHRRQGPDGPPADTAGNPQVNVGTGTMGDRSHWSRVIERFKHDMGAYDFPGGGLDVRENVRFFGGNHPRWAHANFPESACVLAIEVKKFFMDEWTGQADIGLVEAIGTALQATIPGVLEELASL